MDKNTDRTAVTCLLTADKSNVMTDKSVPTTDNYTAPANKFKDHDLKD
ncbi:hypothetical protein OYT88_07405 [Sporolactobacillus sp. CQH2019]|nr:hypothetical protein [Sporolactobacillus sp. CQH2019]